MAEVQIYTESRVQMLTTMLTASLVPGTAIPGRKDRPCNSLPTPLAQAVCPEDHAISRLGVSAGSPGQRTHLRLLLTGPDSRLASFLELWCLDSQTET